MQVSAKKLKLNKDRRQGRALSKPLTHKFQRMVTIMENQTTDLFSKLQQVLSTSEGQEQLKNISAMFSNQPGQQSMGAQQAPPSPSPAQSGGGLDMNAISSLLQGFMGGNGSDQGGQVNQSEQQPNATGGIDMGMILKLQQMFQGMNKSDKNTDLLLALKPHFSEKRCKRVDQAISMMRLFSMLPMLKESGLFAGL